MNFKRNNMVRHLVINWHSPEECTEIMQENKIVCEGDMQVKGDMQVYGSS